MAYEQGGPRWLDCRYALHGTDPIYRQAKGLAVTEEVGGAKEVFQSGWGPTNGNRACIEGTNEDLTSFGGPLLFHDVSATTSG